MTIKSLKIKKKIKDIDYIIINKSSNTNPYFKAFNLLKNIIENLTEDSRLFEPFLYFDSGTIINYLEKDEFNNVNYENIFGEIEEKKKDEFISEYGLTLMNINSIKKHLIQLMPNVIIRIAVDIDFNAYYEKTTGVMVINELILFGHNVSEMDKNYADLQTCDNYIIPILLEMLHEKMGHGIIRIFDEEAVSPRFYSDSLGEFEYQNIYKTIREKGELKKILVPESGKVLENYISKNKLIIIALKYPCEENKILANYIYWIGENFHMLEEIVLNTIKILKEKNANLDDRDKHE